ncbi:hypothetical protein VIGAN_10192600, partial [Vigna angularis var. angularis]
RKRPVTGRKTHLICRTDKTKHTSLLFSSLIYHSLPILSHASSFPSLSDNNNEEKKKTLLHTSFSFSPSTHDHRHQQYKLTFPPSHAAQIRAEVVVSFLRRIAM